MHHSYILWLASLLFALQVAALPATEANANLTAAGSLAGERGGPCPFSQYAVPLLRAYSSSLTDHFYTTDPQEMEMAVKAGYVQRGYAGRVFQTRQPYTVAFYRLWNEGGSDHFYTTSMDMRDILVKRGFTDEGIAGYVFDKQRYRENVPLYRLHHQKDIDTFYTVSWKEKEYAKQYYGYTEQPTAAYVFP
ncbi:hypothetical protein HGRIS_007221 [Hohenbuehelia grisea]|uniref:DUF5648 domain-containing protein n=1 Tax=Hohenbuehelia grisea TaxID=104357 RepID=A0ABR3JBT1_9AGAR